MGKGALITGIIITMVGIILLIISLAVALFLLIYAIPLIIFGIILIILKGEEDKIEKRKDRAPEIKPNK